MRGAQRARPIKSIGEGARTTQRSRWLSQQFFNRLLAGTQDAVRKSQIEFVA
jgi:hypothetical protein